MFQGKGGEKKAFITAREQQTHGDIAVARMLLKFNEKWQLEKCCCFRKKKKRGIGLEIVMIKLAKQKGGRIESAINQNFSGEEKV